MKSRTIKVILVVVYLTNLTSTTAFGQKYPQPARSLREANEECLAYLINGGLREEYTTKTGTSFFEDARTYFLSDEFRKDYENNKWSGSISAFGVELAAGSNSPQVREFQHKVQSATSTVIDNRTYTTISKSTINVAAANAYNECVSGKYGLRIDASGDKRAGVQITYRTLGQGDPVPVLASAYIDGMQKEDIDRIMREELYPGRKIMSISFIGARIPGEELVIALNLRNGVSLVKRFEADDDGGGAAPVGTVITSTLDYETFSNMVKNHEQSPTKRWDPKHTKWAPCDGRTIDGSKYSKWAKKMVTNDPDWGKIAPDMRGIFIRGLNKFANDQPSEVPINQKNAAATTVGQFQNDAFKHHRHLFGNGNYSVLVGQYRKSPDRWGVFNQAADSPYGADDGTSETGEEETRPKNRSLYYYIRIN